MFGGGGIRQCAAVWCESCSGKQQAGRRPGAAHEMSTTEHTMPMGEFLDREHFIPVRVVDLINYLCDEHGPMTGEKLFPEERAAFRRFSRSVVGHVHVSY